MQPKEVLEELLKNNQDKISTITETYISSLIKVYAGKLDTIQDKYEHIASEKDLNALESCKESVGNLRESFDGIMVAVKNLSSKVESTEEIFSKYDKLFPSIPGVIRIIVSGKDTLKGEDIDTLIGVKLEKDEIVYAEGVPDYFDVMSDFQNKVENKIKQFSRTRLNPSMNEYFMNEVEGFKEYNEESEIAITWDEYVKENRHQMFYTVKFENGVITRVDKEVEKEGYKELFSQKAYEIDSIIEDVFEVYKNNKGVIVEAHPNLKRINEIATPLTFLKDQLYKKRKKASNRNEVQELAKWFRDEFDQIILNYPKLAELLAEYQRAKKLN